MIVITPGEVTVDGSVYRIDENGIKRVGYVAETTGKFHFPSHRIENIPYVTDPKIIERVLKQYNLSRSMS